MQWYLPYDGKTWPTLICWREITFTQQTFYKIVTLDINICAVNGQYIENRFWQSALLTQPTHDITIINIIKCIKVKAKFDWIYTKLCLNAHLQKKNTITQNANRFILFYGTQYDTRYNSKTWYIENMCDRSFWFKATKSWVLKQLSLLLILTLSSQLSLYYI